MEEGPSEAPLERGQKLLFFAAVLIIAALTFAGLRLYEQGSHIEFLYAEQDRLNRELEVAKSAPVQRAAEPLVKSEGNQQVADMRKEMQESVAKSHHREGELQGLIDFLNVELKAANETIKKLQEEKDGTSRVDAREQSGLR